MGQYFKVINKTKKEILNPHTFGSGLKLWEIINSRGEILQGLALLLAEGHQKYDKNYQPIKSDIIGRWKGDKISIMGDYVEHEVVKDGEVKLQNFWESMYDDEGISFRNGWKDISIETYKELLQDDWQGRRKAKQLKKKGTYMMIDSEKELMEELFPKECHEGDLRWRYKFKKRKQSEE